MVGLESVGRGKRIVTECHQRQYAGRMVSAWAFSQPVEPESRRLFRRCLACLCDAGFASGTPDCFAVGKLCRDCDCGASGDRCARRAGTSVDNSGKPSPHRPASVRDFVGGNCDLVFAKLAITPAWMPLGSLSPAQHRPVKLRHGLDPH